MDNRKIKTVAVILSFFLLIFAGDRLVGRVLERMVVSSHFRFSKVYQGKNRNDIVILGNSRGVNSFYIPEIERVTGQRGINLSYNGMTGNIVEAVLLDYLEYNEKPKLLIVEITSFSQPKGKPKREGKFVNDMKLYMGQSRRLQEILAGAAPNEFFWSTVSHIYRYNSEIFLRCLFYLNKSDQSWINRNKISRALLDQISSTPDQQILQIGEEMEVLKRIVQVAHQKGIAVRLVVGPYLPAYAKRISKLENWVSEVQKIVGKDAPVWDLSMSIKDPDFFADRVHLNYEGSRILLKDLVKKDFFTFPNKFKINPFHKPV